MFANLSFIAFGYRSSSYLDQTSLGGHLLATNTLFERLCTKPAPKPKKNKNTKKIKAQHQTFPPVLVSLTSTTSIFGGLEVCADHLFI
jgi:hypothetical protein